MSREQSSGGGWFREADYDLMLTELERSAPTSLWSEVRRRFREQRAARWSARLLMVLALLAFFAPLLPLPSPAAMRLAGAPHAPVAPWSEFVNQRYEPVYGPLGALDRALVATRQKLFGKTQLGSWLGTDTKGRDTLARILWGSRTSLLVALCAALTSLSLGVAWGALAGLSGGRVDNLMMRALDVLQSIPTIFVVIFLLSFLNAPSAALGGARLLSREQVFFLVIGAVSWLSMARVVRGQVLALRSAPYVEAARAQGASLVWIVRKHVWPNVLPVVGVYVTLTLPAVILYEAFLSFLGLGVEAPNVSWGVLAADGAEALSPLVSSWWLVAAPSTALAATLLALGLVGDGLRDALDLRRGER
ncbi:MAG: ABC transporter permease [Planctomycetes bacterium]|nr:ABC transporter permease [Planctomycetota bacterium]